jgi:hypothetical protein
MNSIAWAVSMDVMQYVLFFVEYAIACFIVVVVVVQSHQCQHY